MSQASDISHPATPSSLTLGQGPPDNLRPGYADPAGGTVHDYSSVTEGREKPSDIRRTHWVPYSLQVSAHPRGRVPQAGSQTGRPGTGPEAHEIPPAEILHGNCGCCPSSRCPKRGCRLRGRQPRDRLANQGCAVAKGESNVRIGRGERAHDTKMTISAIFYRASWVVIKTGTRASSMNSCRHFVREGLTEMAFRSSCYN